MGNSGSNNSASHQQQCPSGNQEMGRGWTHSFPRELTRHHSQPPGHKVLPEPPNQRLRATNNGSIIHNGGTISGRRPSALTLPHDLNKGVYRSRSTSASNLGPRSRSNDQNQHNCCLYRSSEGRCRDHEMPELKRFGSEPDLRYSPNEPSRNRNHNPTTANHQAHNNHRSQSGNHENRHSAYYPERESRERESRYRGKKKYKAPAPPGNGEGSSPDSYKWEIGQERENCCRPGAEDDVVIQPPPRKSRLFKTRAETKKAQSNWQPCVQDIETSPIDTESRRWRGVGEKSTGKENRCSWREHSEEQENWSRNDSKRISSGRYDGKNTLQRSLSSPEFQAELMQVARKVRNKLNYNRRVGPIGAATVVSSHDFKIDSHGGPRNSSADDLHRRHNQHHRDERKNPRSTRPTDDRRPDKRKPRNFDEAFDGRRDEARTSARFCEDGTRKPRGKCNDRPLKEMRGYENEIVENPGRTRENNDEPRSFENARRRRVVEKSYVYEERITTNATNEHVSGRKSVNERHHEFVENSTDERHPPERLRRTDHEAKNRREAHERTRRSRKPDDNADQPRTRSESPALRNCRDRTDLRGQGSGRESTPEMPRGKEKKSDHRKRRNDTKDDNFVVNEKRWSSSNVKTSHDTVDVKILEKNVIKETREMRTKNWNGLPPSGKSAPKTYYFSVDDGLSRDIRPEEEIQQVDHAHSRLQARDSNDPSNNAQNRTDDSKSQSGTEDIALKLRPTLPKKQLEIPRFSPSAAWRLLSALETPGPTMSTASEEVPVMYEERIERLARPPPPLVALGPRSSHDKSGDSGISGDAGAANDDSLDVSTTNRMKTPATTRPAWTPQQDLGEESSSDAGVDSPPPMAPPIKFPTRPHVFSLSLPRDENRFYSGDAKTTKESSSFNSLQKLKRSVTGALGLVPNEIDDRRRPGEGLGENWLLSSSAPNSLQHNKASRRESAENLSPGWENNYTHEDNDEEIEEEVEANEDKTDFPMVMKPPSFSYLASGGHVMYLPDSNETEHRTQSLNYRNSTNVIGKTANSTKYRKDEDPRVPNKIGSFGINGISINGATRDREIGLYRERSFTDLGTKSRRYPSFFKSCENISEMRQRSVSPVNNGPESLQDPKIDTPNAKIIAKNQKAKRFTFQSTVRQIERRRLAEKLSREAEAKERQRKSELEVMRKVEEEFQRKRAREKANIRQQLRLYSMDENSSSLPPAWDSSQLSRADPDGAPSSSASSPTSAPPGKMANRKSSIGSDEYQHRKRVSESRAQQQQQPPQQREYKDYRPKYYDWAPDSSSHLDVKQTTVHPKVVYDIPKSSHVFVDANVHTAKPANVISTPRSDNYRKDFAHGAVAAKSSLASSDSELSQPNTRPHSRQNGNKSNKPLRSRSASPARSDGAGSEESPVEAIKQERNASANGFILNGVQPFVREKSYRPISFNPRPPPPPIPS